MDKNVVDLVEQSIMNDEFSSDEELVALLVSEGVPQEIAEQAPALRDTARVDPFSTLMEVDGDLFIAPSTRK